MNGGNLLLVADCHISDYKRYNLENRSRLHQSRLLADKIIKAGVDHNCNIIVFCGDIIDVSVSRSYVVYEVKKFLDKVMSHFTYGYIIYGNHDLDSKNNIQSEEDCILSSILPSNLYYADGKLVKEDNTLIAFSNWKPEFDLSWINDKVDLFISHATINYGGNEYFRSQYLDESKFDLAILGDIHKATSLNKLVSIGSTQQCKISDQLESTAVVFNPVDKSWTHINIDEEDELFKMKYTSDRSMEGFIDNYYYVYKPLIRSLNSDTSESSINIPQWEEIEGLVNDIISSNGLDDIHGNVLSNCKYTEEVDFDFRITKIRLKDFRSIEEMTIELNDGDRIRISGGNGQGKSSLILGLKYALIENRSLKDYVRFSANSCECEVEFTYQGINYKLLRGTKTYGLWINGEKLAYNNKREFEDDCHKRFPFIDYMDIYYFTSGQNTVLGSMAPERKSEIISKLFKLDKIDSYNSTAIELYENLKSESNGILNEISSVNNIISYIKPKTEIQLPSMSLDDLKSLKSSMTNQLDEYNRYMSVRDEISRINGSINSTEEMLNSVLDEISKVDVHELNEKLESLKSQHDTKTVELEKAILINSRYSNINARLNEINNRGSELYEKYTKLSQNICPTCGNMMDPERTNEMMNSVSDEMNSLLSEKSELENERNSISNYDTSSIKSEIHSLAIRISNTNFSILTYNSNCIKVNDCRRCIKELNEKLNKLMNISNSSVTELPSDFYIKLEEVNNNINVWKSYNQNVSDLEINTSKLESLNSQVDSILSEMSRYETYINLTGSTGEIYKEVMTRLSTEFSDDIIRYEVNKYKFRGKDHLDLDIQYNVKGRWVSYSSLSSGQQTMADFNFLSRICTGLGILVCDETLKHLSEESTEYILELINNMNIHNVLLSSHMMNINFNNREVRLELDGNGITRII